MQTQEQKVITTTLYRGLAVVATALLGGLVAGAFAAYATLNSDHFTIITLTKDVEAIKTETATHEIASVKRDEVLKQDIADKLETISEQVDYLYKLHLK